MCVRGENAFPSDALFLLFLPPSACHAEGGSSYNIVMTLSVCMIVRNEQKVLARALACARKFADEIIVVDTGSSDDSKDIAAGFGAKVFDFEWADDFADARNYSFSLASGEYVMWLDADDVVDDASAAEIRRTVQSGGFDVAMLPYRSGAVTYMRERIMRRDMHFKWQGAVHEVIAPRGKVVYGNAVVTHKKMSGGDPLRNLFIYQKLIARGICLDERQKFYYGRELFYNAMYRQAVAVLEDFLNGDGWAVNKAEACRTLYMCHKNLGDGDAALTALVRAFVWMTPRAQDCCLLAAEFAERGDLDGGEYWYRRALDSPEKREDGGFVDESFATVVPMLGMAVICDRRGDYAAANEWNERAGAVSPGNASYLYNKNYLATKLNGG